MFKKRIEQLLKVTNRSSYIYIRSFTFFTYLFFLSLLLILIFNHHYFRDTKIVKSSMFHHVQIECSLASSYNKCFSCWECISLPSSIWLIISTTSSFVKILYSIAFCKFIRQYSRRKLSGIFFHEDFNWSI